MESSEEYFTIEFYRRLLQEKDLFDISKLLDLAAIYGKGNSETVGRIIENVLETDPKYFEDMKECFDMLMAAFKRIFRDALRTD